MRTTSRTRIAALGACLATLPLASARALAQTDAAQAEQEKREEARFHQGFVWSGSRIVGVNDFRRLAPMALRGDAYAAAVQKARKLLQEGKHNEARGAFEEAARGDRKYAPYDEWGDALEAAGDIKGAISAYRQVVYGDLKRKDGMVRDWTDRDGRSVRAQVRGTNGEEGYVDRSWSPAVLMRYALLLSRAGETDEALQAYRWGYEASWNYEPRFQGMRPLFDLRMTPRDFDRRLFEAAAHTIIGLTEDTLRTFAFSAWPPNAAVDGYRKALAAKPDYGAAHLFMGEAYLKKVPLDAKYRPAALEAWQKAAAFGSQAVREKAQEKLEGLP